MPNFQRERQQCKLHLDFEIVLLPKRNAPEKSSYQPKGVWFQDKQVQSQFPSFRNSRIWGSKVCLPRPVKEAYEHAGTVDDLFGKKKMQVLNIGFTVGVKHKPIEKKKLEWGINRTRALGSHRSRLEN